jgi:hypothetical protein
MKAQKDVHPEFYKKIQECLEYAEYWANPLANDAGGRDQFSNMYNHLYEVKRELCKED